ncbi:MAG: hypothetical protein A3A86_06760 [Elusimicrobia bacterium RIFCSPLOWO2_01_FULL_60_11]|nr:MAG: hypothetical protein A3A86_06760 [Elusimicrobia bacterium RIFCSPLOWO2_01_FULL_60_11]
MRNADPRLVIVSAILLLLGLAGLNKWVNGKLAGAEMELMLLKNKSEAVEESLAEARSFRDMKEQEMAFFTSGLGSVAQAKKAMYESGLSLQEEKRLLEKQLEIMTTSIKVDPAEQKISLMREDNASKSFKLAFTSTQPVTEAQMKSRSLRVTSKERFAHPERGKAEEKDGVLTWTPPQVGESARSNALGEFVLFTNSNIIIHGPFKKEQEHAAYPHACLGLSREDAARLYRGSFIGNRIYFQ